MSIALGSFELKHNKLTIKMTSDFAFLQNTKNAESAIKNIVDDEAKKRIGT
jgi:hypothetical protein